jgi:VanZ family protein
LRLRAWLDGTPPRYRWLAVAGWMALIFLLSAQPDLPHPGSSWLDLLISSGAHVLVFGVLAFVLAWALGERPGGLPLAFVLALVYALTDESHQMFVPGRHADPMDLLWDAVGALIGLGLWAWLRRSPPG